jgi:FMN-dependent NADH-azoreductase
MCKAKQLYYVTTAGGPIINDAYGYGYVRELAQTFFGIPETYYLKAENLDLLGADPEAILADAIRLWDENLN